MKNNSSTLLQDVDEDMHDKVLDWPETPITKIRYFFHDFFLSSESYWVVLTDVHLVLFFRQPNLRINVVNTDVQNSDAEEVQQPER